MNLNDYPLPVAIFAALGLWATLTAVLLALFLAGARAVRALRARIEGKPSA